MKKILLFIFAMRILACLSAQTTSLYYSSNAGDSIAICGDTVFFRIFNDDAFASFDIGKGIFRQKRNGDLVMKERIPLEWESSTLTMTKQNSNKITIQVYLCDGKSNGFASLLLYFDEKLIETKCFDGDGKIEFDEKTSDFLEGKEIVLRIADLGFDTRHKLTFNKGTKYIVRFIFLNSCYISHDKNIKITFNDDGSINILRDKNKRSAKSLKKN